MGKISKKWLQVYTYTMRYVATIVSFSTLVIDVLILFNKTTIITYSIAGGSLLTLFVIYCGIRFLGYCYIQRCLIWLTGMNIIFNSFMHFSSSNIETEHVLEDVDIANINILSLAP